MKKHALIIATALSTSFGLSFTANAQTPGSSAECGTYTVQLGDTLGRISTKIFGNRDKAAWIYENNRDTIGFDPDLIERGQILTIPCDDRAEAKDDRPEVVDLIASRTEGAKWVRPRARTQIAAAMAKSEASDGGVMSEDELDSLPRLGEPTVTAAVMEEKPVAVQDTATQTAATPRRLPSDQLQLLTGGPLVPLVGQDLDAGGMATELVDRALQATIEMGSYEINFVNDRSAHLSVLMPNGGFDLAFPWSYPNCSDTGLSAEATRVCTDYVASDPLYEQETGFYARAESRMSAVRRASDLAGTTICRPKGASVSDLSKLELLGKVTLVFTDTPAECLRRLDLGLVDVATMDSAVARSLVRLIELENQLIVLEGLASTESLHVIAPRSNPRAVSELERINKGIRKLSVSGEWFEIVERQLSRQPVQ